MMPHPSPLALAMQHRVRITHNAAECRRCGETVESTHRHDFVTCQCGGISVDGGHEYLRRAAERLDLIIDRSTHYKLPAEQVFKRVVHQLLTAYEAGWGRWPGPLEINNVRNLNGAQSRWRREVFVSRGYVKTHEGVGGRWVRA